MPHRRNIIEDEQRVKSVSELPFSPLPHGVPGPWTDQVVKEISSHFQISPKSLPPQLIVQLGICEEGWPYIRKTTRTYHQFTPDKKNAQKNLFGILFSFVPRRLLPDKHRTQSHSTFFWAHNTNMQAAISILRDEELIRPSKWQEQPPPNRDYTNWPPMGFYCRGSRQSHEAAVKAAAQFAGVHTDRPMCIGGSARLRQQHCTIPRGGVYADIAASHYYDCIHAKDQVETPLIDCGSQLRGNVLVNDFGNPTPPFALAHRGLCPGFRGIHHDALLPEKACGVA